MWEHLDRFRYLENENALRYHGHHKDISGYADQRPWMSDPVAI